MEGKLPIFDADLEITGVSKMKGINASSLIDLDHPIAFTGPRATEPIAVLIPYRLYLTMQDALMLGALCVQRWTFDQDFINALGRAGFTVDKA